MKMRIFRYDGEEARYDKYDVPERPGQTVLDALFYIQDKLDDSLAFRYSCRGAVCGSCAMLINKVPRLACRTQMKKLLEGELETDIDHYKALDEGADLEENEILVEPLPHLPVLKDLIVDMDRFFDYYKDIEPTFKPKDENPEKERLINTQEVQELEKYTNCILCASCFGSCPVNGEMKEYKGPASLAKLYRFYIDPREGDNEYRLDTANKGEGWWACEFHANCKKVCPKGVPPNLAIGQARRKLKEMKEDD